mmetsp:Transcript_33778/g.99539  ORF Transcript_33778/g.99539 Transcript_33778/m.99539 type:complete len:202 (+) Transcript_33778:553-1158(+)
MPPPSSVPRRTPTGPESRWRRLSLTSSVPIPSLIPIGITPSTLSLTTMRATTVKKGRVSQRRRNLAQQVGWRLMLRETTSSAMWSNKRGRKRRVVPVRSTRSFAWLTRCWIIPMPPCPGCVCSGPIPSLTATMRMRFSITTFTSRRRRTITSPNVCGPRGRALSVRRMAWFWKWAISWPRMRSTDTPSHCPNEALAGETKE